MGLAAALFLIPRGIASRREVRGGLRGDFGHCRELFPIFRAFEQGIWLWDEKTGCRIGDLAFYLTYSCLLLCYSFVL